MKELKDDELSVEEDYEDLVSGIDLDPRQNIELSSSEKKKRRGKLAKIIAGLLDEKRKKELIWENIQKKKLDDSAKNLVPAVVNKNHHVTPKKVDKGTHKHNVSMPATTAARKLMEI